MGRIVVGGVRREKGCENRKDGNVLVIADGEDV